MAAAALASVPLAEKGIQASVDLAKSISAQVLDALRTPLLGWEQTISKTTRSGKSVRTVQKANIPAWAAIVGGLVIAASLGRVSVPGVATGVRATERPWWWPPLAPWPA